MIYIFQVRLWQNAMRILEYQRYLIIGMTISFGIKYMYNKIQCKAENLLYRFRSMLSNPSSHMCTTVGFDLPTDFEFIERYDYSPPVLGGSWVVDGGVDSTISTVGKRILITRWYYQVPRLPLIVRVF